MSWNHRLVKIDHVSEIQLCEVFYDKEGQPEMRGSACDIIIDVHADTKIQKENIDFALYSIKKAFKLPILDDKTFNEE